MRISKTAKLEAEITRLRAIAEPEPRIEITASFQYTLSHQWHGGQQYESTTHFQAMKIVGGVPLSEAEQWQDKLDAAAKKAALKGANAVLQQLQDGTFRQAVDGPPHKAAQANTRAFEQYMENK